MIKIMKTLIVTSVVSIFAINAEASCPDKKTVEDAFKKVFKKDAEILNIAPTKISNICEVHIKFLGQNNVLYVDSKGEYLIPAQIFRVSDGVNLTDQTIAELNKLTGEEMKKLDTLTAFTVGKSGPIVYFVTDPQCPYCKKAEEILTPLAEKGELQVKFLLYPLPFHKGAREESISIICDNKGLDGLRKNYRSENQCDKGKKTVEETVNFLSSKGISGTPTYIFANGTYHVGMLEEARLKELLKNNEPKDTSKSKK